MKFPPFLKIGDTLGIAAPAGKVEKDYLEFAENILAEWGLKIKTGKNILKKNHGYAGNDDERTADFQALLDDSKVKAIFCARGGYGTIRIVERLKFDKFKKNPKWIVGFSDITILHAFCNNVLGIASIHAVMPINFQTAGAEKSLQLLKNTLFGDLPEYEWPHQQFNLPGKVKGILTGGNFSVLFGLRNTSMDIVPEHRILFLEDVGEKVYHLDRLLQNYKLSGVFSKINGLVIGAMTEVTDERFKTGCNVPEIIYKITKNLNIPVAYSFPAGHQPENFPLILGAEIIFESGDKNSKITLKN